MLINSDDLAQLIDQEIRWCIDNPDKALHKEYQKGFINGLIQAKYLLGQLCAIKDNKFKAWFTAIDAIPILQSSPWKGEREMKDE